GLGHILRGLRAQCEHPHQSAALEDRDRPCPAPLRAHGARSRLPLHRRGAKVKSLRARVLLLLVGFGLLMAAMLAAIMYASVREYYNDWIYDKSASFAERMLEAHPNLWRDYERDPGGFGQQLRQYTLYSPNTGLYLVDGDG